MPTHLKVVKGTDRPGRLNAAEPKPAADKIKMPRGLSDKARTHWRAISGELKAAGILTNVDVHALRLLCEAFADYVDANERLKNTGPVIKGPAGLPMVSPLFSVVEKSHKRVLGLLTEFGMTPSSRTRVAAVEKAPEADPFADF